MKELVEETEHLAGETEIQFVGIDRILVWVN
jgi:hypothetical protein